jgi:hypothetical protein
MADHGGRPKIRHFRHCAAILHKSAIAVVKNLPWPLFDNIKPRYNFCFSKSLFPWDKKNDCNVDMKSLKGFLYFVNS